MKSVIKYIVVAAIGALICFIIFGKCHNDALQVLSDSITTEKSRNDSIRKEDAKVSAANNETIVTYRIRDAVQTQKIDSLEGEVSRWKASFTVQKNATSRLLTRMDSLIAANDTVGVWDVADSLSKQLTVLNQVFFEWQLSKDSTEQAMKDEIIFLHQTIDTLQGQITQFKQLLVQCTDNAAALSKTAQKATRKAKLSDMTSKIGIGLVAVLTVILFLNHK